MKLLITGGAGFIGSHVVEAVLAQGHQVVVYDNLSSGRRDFLPQAEGLAFVYGDVREGQALEELCRNQGFDGCIHLAAQTMVPYSLAHPQEDCQINLVGLLNLLEACRKYGIGRLVFASSAAVYGDNAALPLAEEEVPRPLSCYGLTKLASEGYLRLYAQLYGLRAACLRFANVYGPRQGAGGEGGVISVFAKAAAAGRGLTIYGDGRQTRDYVYVGDVAQAVLQALQLEGYHIINVSTAQETDLLQLVAAMEAAAGRQLPLAFAPARPGDIYRSVLANRRCQELLGLKPATSLSAGVEAAYGWFRREGAV